MLGNILASRKNFFFRVAHALTENPQWSQQVRTTYVLKRKHPAPLVRPGRFPSLRKKHRVYETIEDNEDRPQNLTILLDKYVEGIGRPGDVVSTKENIARELLLTKFARYASEENVKTAGKDLTPDDLNYSSRFVGFTIRELTRFVLNISMNNDNPWTLESWHIRAAFRKAHVTVPEYAFTMPEEPIKGPNMDLEGKEFYITVTINNTEKVPVRCRIHHWTTEERDRLPPVRDHWKFPSQPIFPKDAEIAKSLPEMIPPDLKPDDGPKHMKNMKKRFG